MLFWGAQVSIWVAKEWRHNSNEIVLGRPDIKHIVGYYRRPGSALGDTQNLLIREFSSPATTTEDGFIYEVPGGSGMKKEDPAGQAATELKEETGLSIDAKRLRPLDPRQVAGTTSTHKAHCFTPELTRKEMGKVGSLPTAGNAMETEITYPMVVSLKSLVESPMTDWANLGMIFTALLKTEMR